MSQTTIRTRFAPSPTGFMHVGNLRTALYAYLTARSMGGTFILRIEDTDQERQVEGAIERIYDTLHTCGLHWDEGPDIGGPFAPYVQSERKDQYHPVAEQLVAEGKAYRCFCSEERLQRLKSTSGSDWSGYDRHCRNLNADEVQARMEAGGAYVIRQKMPLEGETRFVDEVFGEITVPNTELEDQILLKSDGFPTYNFANVVDDHAMGITHVIRGSEYLSSTPKYNLLYEALGYPLPTYIHLPLINGTDGQKLSKRHGATSFQDLMREGYLPEAVVNYLALLGWSPGTEQEVFSMAELETAFSIKQISKSPAVFDYKKLRWFNTEYFKRMSTEDFTELCLPYFEEALPDRDYDWTFLASLLQPRLEVLTDIDEKVEVLKAMPEDYELELFTQKKQKSTAESSLTQLELLRPRLEALTREDWTRDNLQQLLVDQAAEQEVKNGVVMWPARIAVSGLKVTPGGAAEILYLLGRDEALTRYDRSLERLRSSLS